MSSEEFIQVPKKMYLNERPITEQLLQDPQLKQKGMQLSMLQRMEPQKKQTEAEIEATASKNTLSVKDIVFSQLKTSTESQIKKSEYIYDIIISDERVDVDSTGQLTVDNTNVGLLASTFLYNLQQSTKTIDISLYTNILGQLNIPEQFVANKHGKEIIRDSGPATKYRKESGKSPTKGWASLKA